MQSLHVQKKKKTRHNTKCVTKGRTKMEAKDVERKSEESFFGATMLHVTREDVAVGLV